MAPKKQRNGGDKRRVGRYTSLPKQWNTRLSQPEVKIWTEQFSGINAFGGTTGLITEWSAVPQGLSSAERVGQKIQPAKFEAHVNVGLSTGLTGGRFTRVIFFQWFEDGNVIVPTAADILQNTGSGADLVCSPYRRTTRRVFKVLYDTNHVLYDALPAKQLVMSRGPNQLRPLTYGDDGNSVTGVGMIYSLVVSDAPSSPGDVHLSIAVKLGYTDS